MRATRRRTVAAAGLNRRDRRTQAASTRPPGCLEEPLQEGLQARDLVLIGQSEKLGPGFQQPNGWSVPAAKKTFCRAERSSAAPSPPARKPDNTTTITGSGNRTAELRSALQQPGSHRVRGPVSIPYFFTSMPRTSACTSPAGSARRAAASADWLSQGPATRSRGRRRNPRSRARARRALARLRAGPASAVRRPGPMSDHRAAQQARRAPPQHAGINDGASFELCAA